MGFFGAGFAVGAATAVTKKLSNKKNKEEERFEALSNAFDQGKSEFDLTKGSTKKNMNSLYKRTEDFVVASGVVTSLGQTDGEGNFEYQGTLDAIESMGIKGLNLYAGTTGADGIFKHNTDPKGNKLLNTNIDNKTLTHALTKIGLAKLSSANLINENFNINNGAHFEAILNARIGKNSKFKPALLRDEKDGKVINTSVLNSGYELGAYADPVAKKVGIGQRISNFLNPTDDQELIKRIAQENKISIDDAKRLIKAGQTEEQDAFAPADLEANLGSEYEDLPDISLQNLFALIPTDADSMAKVEANAISILGGDTTTVKNLVYIDANLPEQPSHIDYSLEAKAFKDRQGNIISNDKIVKVFSDIQNNQQTNTDLSTILPEWQAGDKRYIGDASNMTDYFGEVATLFTRAGEGMIKFADLQKTLLDRGFPDLAQVKGEEEIIKEVLAKLSASKLKFNTTLNHWRTETTIPENADNMSGALNGITRILKSYSVKSEDLIPMANIVMAKYITEFAEKHGTLNDKDVE